MNCFITLPMEKHFSCEASHVCLERSSLDYDARLSIRSFKTRCLLTVTTLFSLWLSNVAHPSQFNWDHTSKSLPSHLLILSCNICSFLADSLSGFWAQKWPAFITWNEFKWKQRHVHVNTSLANDNKHWKKSLHDKHQAWRLEEAAWPSGQGGGLEVRRKRGQVPFWPLCWNCSSVGPSSTSRLPYTCFRSTIIFKSTFPVLPLRSRFPSSPSEEG